MVSKDDKYIVHGGHPIESVRTEPLGRWFYNKLLKNQDSKHAAMIDANTKQSISYEKILHATCSLAEALRSDGYGKDTVISISSENNVEFFIPIIAAFYIGAAVAPLNHNYTEYELKHALSISKPKVIFCSPNVVDKFQKVRQDLPFIEKIVMIDATKSVPGADCLDDYILKKLEKGYVTKFEPIDVNAAEHVALILCSSGTTGLPKGVMLTHLNVHIPIMNMHDFRYMSFSTDEVVFGILPFFHAYGLLTSLGCLAEGWQVVALRRFEEKIFLQTIQDHKISKLWLAPPLVIFLAKHPLVKNYDLSSVKEVLSGAAPLGKDIEEEIKKRLNIDVIRQGYGLTEATLAVIVMPPFDVKRGSSGKVIPHMMVKVRDPESGASLGPNQIGEICIKGPMVMKGYCGNTEATRNTFTADGWLLTGDLGYYDHEEYFFIVDRIKELIKYKGFQVAPAELEAILLNHPKIKDTAVVGLPDQVSGELPLAFVVKAPGAQLTQKEVQDYVKGLVSSQKQLRGGVYFVDQIPKNPTGKILRRELRELLKKHVPKL